MNSIVHDIPGTLYCGPAVLAAITGLHTSAFAGLNASRKCTPDVVRDTLRLHGFVMSEVTPDLALCLIEPLSLCIVDPGHGHWVLVENGMLVDSGNRTPVDVANTRFSTSEVRWQYTITKL